MTTDLLTGYNVHTGQDRERMLEAIGVSTIEDLFSLIPPEIRLKERLDIEGPLTEWDLESRMRSLADRNANTRTHLSFLGGGAYDHYIPAVVDAIVSRGEFLTAYTPYQPEMSQGLLRVLHDFQVLVGKLLGLPAVNCSVYDGATAMAEMAWMACVIKGRNRIAVADSIWPDYRSVLGTYLAGRGVEIVEVASDPETGVVILADLESTLADGQSAAFLFQTPNRFGVLESVARISDIAHAHDALSNVNVNPLLMGVSRPPGECGADIVCAEAQTLGIPLSAGGPYLGAVATHEDYAKYLPGRIVGVLDDIKGEPALALISEEREQHVSRDKATSHICSNQALLALRVVIHLSSLGEKGLQNVARLCAAKAHALAEKLTKIPGVHLARSGSFFNEFLIELPCEAAPVLKLLENDHIFAGIDFCRFDSRVRDQILIAVTEKHSKAEIERFADALHRTVYAVAGPR